MVETPLRRSRRILSQSDDEQSVASSVASATRSTNNDVIAYTLNGKAVRDSAKLIVVIHNPNPGATSVNLPNKGKWSVLVKGSVAGTKVIESFSANKVSVAGQTTMVLTQ